MLACLLEGLYGVFSFDSGTTSMGNVQHSLSHHCVFEERSFTVELWPVKDGRDEEEEPTEGEVASEHQQQGDDDQVNHYF